MFGFFEIDSLYSFQLMKFDRGSYCPWSLTLLTFMTILTLEWLPNLSRFSSNFLHLSFPLLIFLSWILCRRKMFSLNVTQSLAVKSNYLFSVDVFRQSSLNCLKIWHLFLPIFHFYLVGLQISNFFEFHVGAHIISLNDNFLYLLFGLLWPFHNICLFDFHLNRP